MLWAVMLQTQGFCHEEREVMVESREASSLSIGTSLVESLSLKLRVLCPDQHQCMFGRSRSENSWPKKG